MSVLITEVKIIDPGSTHHGKRKNVLINKGLIEYIGKDAPKANSVIDGKACLLSTGWVDLKANFCDPGLEHKEDLKSGRKAAQAGGFTEVALLPNTEPVIQSKSDIEFLQRGNKESLVQIYPIAAITKDCKGEELTEMLDMEAAGAVAFSDGNNPIWNTDILLKSLQYVQKFNGLIIDRPEDKWLSLFGTMNEGLTSTLTGMKGIPNLAEDLAVSRDLDVLRYSGGRLHLSNISSASSVDLIRKAKKEGLNVTCDVAAYQLVFDETKVGDFDTNYRVSPPLRSKKDIKGLIKGLKDGTIDAIVSSHEPQDTESKKLEFDNSDAGISSIQHVLGYLNMIDSELSIEDLIPKLTSHPRQILGLSEPTILEGEKANLTLIDPKVQWTFTEDENKSKSLNTPLLNQVIQGKILAVFNNNLSWLA